MSKRMKITLTVLLVVTFIACIPFNVWYFYLLSKKQDHIVSYTFEVGKQNLSDGSSSKYFVEVEYNSNEDKNGREEFGIKFNYMLDENQTAFYSQGLQYVAKENDGKLGFTLHKFGRESHRTKNLVGWQYIYSDRLNCIRIHEDYATRYNYMSSDDYKTPVLSSNPINENTMFKIQLGNQLYGMKFKGEIPVDDYQYQYQAFWKTYYEKNYKVYDVDYFASILFNSIKSLKNGTQRALAFEFGDLFDYFEYNAGTGKYDKKVDAGKVQTLTTDVKSYYSILLSKTSAGVERASDSMFNIIEGNSGFNISKNIAYDDYFIGRSIINCTLNDFTKVKLNNTDIALKLSKSFLNDYEKYSEKIRLIVLIDLDELKNEKFLGFTNDSGLSKFVVQSCQTKQTIDGQIVYKAVAYD